MKKKLVIKKDSVKEITTRDLKWVDGGASDVSNACCPGDCGGRVSVAPQPY